MSFLHDIFNGEKRQTIDMELVAELFEDVSVSRARISFVPRLDSTSYDIDKLKEITKNFAKEYIADVKDWIRSSSNNPEGCIEFSEINTIVKTEPADIAMENTPVECVVEVTAKNTMSLYTILKYSYQDIFTREDYIPAVDYVNLVKTQP